MTPGRGDVTVLIGPARSGKAAVVRRRYLDLAGRTAPSRVLLLVPTSHRRTATLDALLAESGGNVLWQMRVMTFPRYAEGLVRDLGATVRRIDASQRRRIVAHAFQRGIVSGSVRRLGRLADHPGIVDSLDQFIHRLKSSEIRPEAFAQGLPSGASTLADAAAVYAAYQALLAEHDLYDDAGLFWQARDAMHHAADDLPWPQHVLVDGFQDFAPPQRDILRAMAERGASLLVTLPCQRDRPQVFAPTLRTLDALADSFGDAMTIEESEPAPQAAASPLARIERELFALEAPGVTPVGPEAVTFVETAGAVREVEHLARLAKTMIIDGTVTGPADIAVILRSAEPYAALVAEVFPRYGLPVSDVPSERLDAAPPVLWVMGLLRLPESGYRYSDLAAAVRSPYFPAEAFGAAEAEIETADHLLHTLGVLRGLGETVGAIRRKSRELARQADRDDEDAAVLTAESERAGRVAGLIERVAARLDAMPRRTTRRAHCEHVSELVRDLSLTKRAAQAGDVEIVARDLRSLSALEEVLDALSDFDAWLGPAEMTRGEFLSELAEAVRSTEVTRPPPLGGGVRLLDAYSSRALSFPVVLMPGMNDGHWPHAYRPHMLETPEQRPALERSGLPVTDRSEHMSQERFLFYMALTRTTERLVLSRPAADEHGRPQLSSPFWDHLRELCGTKGGEPAPVETVTVRDTELPIEQVTTRDELRRVALSLAADVGHGATDAMSAMLRCDPAAMNILTSVAALRERESERPFGRFDGCLSDARVLDALARQYPGEAVLSTTRLQDYLWCPFRFFAVSVLGLRPWERPSEYFEEAEVGEIYHAALREFYCGRAGDGEHGTRLPSAPLDALREEMATAVDRAMVEIGGDAAAGGVFEGIQRQEVLDRLLAYIDAERERCAASPLAIEPRQFEWAFGQQGFSNGASGTETPLEVATDDGPVRLRGRIDRVDTLRDGSGPVGLAVVDYKSGGVPNAGADIAEGRALQLPIYMMAARRFISPDLGPPVQGVYWSLKQMRARAMIDGATKRKADDVEAILEAARSQISGIVGASRRGEFPPVPSSDCPSWCEFRGLCRTARWRVQRKTPEEAPDAAD